jgi:lysozyme family protein
MTEDRFEIANAFTEKWEGALTTNNADRGGITNWGVSLRFLQDYARSNRAYLDSLGVLTPIVYDSIRLLTKKQAHQIFKRAFWDQPLRLSEFPRLTSIMVYDGAINHGPGNAVRMLQRACNDFQEGERLVVDGLIGPRTRARTFSLGGAHDRELATNFINHRENFFHAIVRNDPSQNVFLRGWLNRVTDQRRFLQML